jgi:hypothetical protein
MAPTFFAAPQDFRAWLEAYQETETELLVGFTTIPLLTRPSQRRASGGGPA